MVTQVQPLFEAVVVFAWCILSSVLPNERIATQPEPTREEAVDKAVDRTFKELETGVFLHSPDRYLAQFSPELREKHKAGVTAALKGSRCNLVMRYKLEPVSVGSYEATYKAKILTQDICNTGYQDNIEYATVTLAPVPESGDDKFHTKPAEDPADMRWEITKWETEKVVPYDPSKDR